MNIPVLSIVIVTYNNSDVITDCLASLPWSSIPIEAIIIDNNSLDGTVLLIQTFRQNNPDNNIILIQQPANVGYAAGINIGLKEYRGDYVMLLGPDTRLQEQAAASLISSLTNTPGAGMAAPLLIQMDGRTHSSVRTFPRITDLIIELSGLPRIFPGRISPAWKLENFDYTRPSEVDQPEASCILCKRDAVNQVGLMDEQFPMFFNDVDWCRRFRSAGWKIIYQPAASVIHLKGTSVYAERGRMIWESHRGFYHYLAKYSSSLKDKFLLYCCIPGLIITAAVRSLFWALGNFKK